MAKLKSYINGSWVEIGGNASIIEDTYANIKALRDESKLVKGQLYRITNYVATTSQTSTQSASKQFDVIVLATSANTISEDAWAINHTFTSGTDPFASCDLNAWKIKYSLDANQKRWAWTTQTALTIAGSIITETKSSYVYRQYKFYQDYVEFSVCATADGKHWVLENGKQTAEANADVSYPEHAFDLDLSEVETIGEVLSSTSFRDSGGTLFTKIEDTDTIKNTLTNFDGVVYDLYVNEYDGYYYTNTITAEGNKVFELETIGAIAAADSIESTKVPVDNFTGVIYYMKDEWGNEAGFDFKGIQIQNTIVSTCSQTSYISTTYWVDKYVPTGSSVYGYTLGTTTAWYYLFSNTADTDASLTGDCISNVVNYTSTYIPLYRISSSYNTIKSRNNYYTIVGANNIITDCTNAHIACSYNTLRNCNQTTLGSGGGYNDLDKAQYCVTHILQYCVIHNSTYLILNAADSCHFIENCNYIYNNSSAASYFKNNKFTATAYVYCTNASAQITNNTFEYCAGSSSSVYAFKISVAGKFYNNQVTDCTVISVDSNTPAVYRNTFTRSKYIYINCGSFYDNTVVAGLGTSSSSYTLQCTSGAIYKNTFTRCYRISCSTTGTMYNNTLNNCYFCSFTSSASFYNNALTNVGDTSTTGLIHSEGTAYQNIFDNCSYIRLGSTTASTNKFINCLSEGSSTSFYALKLEANVFDDVYSSTIGVNKTEEIVCNTVNRCSNCSIATKFVNSNIYKSTLTCSGGNSVVLGGIYMFSSTLKNQTASISSAYYVFSTKRF